MHHHHLNHESYTLAGIDDVIARGKRQDWADLYQAAKEQPALWEKVVRVCAPNVEAPSAQRHFFWLHYAKQQIP